MAIGQPRAEELAEAECLRLLAGGYIGRIGYEGRFGPTVLPVSYVLHGNSVVFRTSRHSPLGEDLRTGIPGTCYLVAFEVDEISPATQEGWSVLIQGAAQHLDDPVEPCPRLQSWAGGEKDLFIRIVPARITGRRIAAI